MAIIRKLTYTTGAILKAVVRDFSSGGEMLWNVSGTPAFEAYNAVNIASYGIVVTEGSPGTYHWTVPVLPVSVVGQNYEITIYLAAGASLAVGDLANPIAEESFAWDGAYPTVKYGNVKILGLNTTGPDAAHDLVGTNGDLRIDLAKIFHIVDWSTITGEPAKCSLNALRMVRSRWRLTPIDSTHNLLTVYKEDGTTVAWQETLTGSSGADPIVETSG